MQEEWPLCLVPAGWWLTNNNFHRIRIQELKMLCEIPDKAMTWEVLKVRTARVSSGWPAVVAWHALPWTVHTASMQ